LLHTPAPFPQVGSWALLQEEGRDLAVRITATVPGEPGQVVVSIAGAFVASAVKRLPLAALRNADALTPDEQAELAAVEARVAGKSRPKKADVARQRELSERDSRAGILRAVLARVPAKHFPAAGEAIRERSVGVGR
jgi:hypothetical protein